MPPYGDDNESNGGDGDNIKLGCCTRNSRNVMIMMIMNIKRIMMKKEPKHELHLEILYRLRYKAYEDAKMRDFS